MIVRKSKDGQAAVELRVSKYPERGFPSAHFGTAKAAPLWLVIEIRWLCRRARFHRLDDHCARFENAVRGLPTVENPGAPFPKAIGQESNARRALSARPFWMRADMNWHAYPEDPAQTFEEFLAELEADPQCRFFG